MNKSRWWILAAILIVVLFGGWYLWHRAGGPDREVKQLADEMGKRVEETFKNPDRAPAESPPGPPPEVREKIEKLTPDQRGQFFGEMMKTMMKRVFEPRMDEYLKAPPEKKQEILDRHIDEMEKMRERFAHNGGSQGAAGQGNAAQGGDQGQNRPPFQRPTDQEGRQKMMKQMLDNTTPEQRAKFQKYFGDLQQRRKDRGLPEMRGPGGRM